MIIKATGTITILANSKTVFEYLSNLENDKFWRKEINATSMKTKPQIHALATEDAFLSKRRPNNILNLICTQYSEHERVVYQTMSDSKFFLKSDRQVEPISPNETTVIYSIEFDKSIVKHGLGFTLPTFIVNFVTKRDMKKYLSQLKTVIENKNTEVGKNVFTLS
jgi:hypothetical protein